MLSGIKTGKKKKKPKTSEDPGPPAIAAATGGSDPNLSDTATKDNLSVAERLRQSLLAGGGDALDHNGAGTVNAYTQQASVLDQLQRRGRIDSTTVAASNDESNVIVELPLGKTAAPATLKKEEDMTVQELVAQERRENQGMSWDEQMTRNMARLGKNKKRKLNASRGEDSDDEVEQMKQWLPGATNTKEGTKKHERATEKAQQRDQHRLMNEKLQEDKVTSKCSWWLESSSFRKHRLLALGNYVSLVMAPPNASLIPGNHFYIVPLKHAPSFVQVMADEDMGIWKEVQRFQTSLQNLYARQGKSVILLETVLEHSKGLWQTKLEVIPVPFGTLQDAPMYFQSAMREQTEEWGTHNKLLKVSTQKPLSSVIPKGFPYFFVEWGNIATSPTATGYAQIIESESFRHDFGLDTVAGMLELDPVRLQRKQSYSHEEERQQIADFLKLWEKVDWTKELDAADAK